MNALRPNTIRVFIASPRPIRCLWDDVPHPMVSRFAMCAVLHLWDDLSHPIGDFMRYDKEHKAKTHTRIVKGAAQRVRSEGLTGASVSTVMQDTGLTHGGFYKHFPSKND